MPSLSQLLTQPGLGLRLVQSGAGDPEISWVSTTELVKLAGTISPRAKYVLVHGYDHGWTTNLPLDMFLAPDALIATHHDGEPLTAEHGAPARLIVPLLYAWKSAKWIGAIEFTEDDRPGFWERNGYHMNGNPWTEERFGGY